ncbi:MAG: glycosyltransferase [Acidimicrobiia bacterium]|nr:glycosyltransferase [Acidimicrobiia bacterium]
MTPVREGWSIGVVIPAHDEAATIGACIANVRRSLGAATFADAAVVVVADRCRDRTADAARTALGADGTVIDTTAGNVGTARRVGTGRVLHDLRRRRRGLRHDHTWLLATDADTLVPVDWVRSHLCLAEAGATGVAGIVHVDTFAEHHASVADAFTRTYAFHDDGSHPHVHGANLGVRADAYLSVGGWPELDTAEDHALWSRLRNDGWPTVSSIEARVTTSGRLVGRAPEGFAGHLGSLASPVPAAAAAPSRAHSVVTSLSRATTTHRDPAPDAAAATVPS